MPIRAQIVSEWVGTGDIDNPRRPKVKDDYPFIGFVDVTGQPAENIPPFPNALVIEGVWADTVFAQLEADPAYQDGILWSEVA